MTDKVNCKTFAERYAIPGVGAHMSLHKKILIALFFRVFSPPIEPIWGYIQGNRDWSSIQIDLMVIIMSNSDNQEGQFW